MFGPIPRSRLGLQNVCASCLATLLRRDLVRTQTRQINSSATHRNDTVSDINSVPGDSHPLISNTKSITDVFPTLKESLPLLDTANRKARRAGKRPQKPKEATVGSDATPQNDQLTKSRSKDVQEPKTPVKSGRAASKANKKKTAAATAPSQVVESAESSKLGPPASKKKKKSGVVGTSPSKITESTDSASAAAPLALPEPAEKKQKLNPTTPIIRRTLAVAKSPDMQRLIAKTHILRLNEQGGFSDSDKLQIMEHFRRSMEDKALAEVVSFTKRRSTSTTASVAAPRTNFVSSKYTLSPNTSALLQKEEDSNPGDLKTFKPLASAKPDPSIEPIEKSSSLTAYEIQTIEAHKLNLVPLEVPQPPVPKLSYGLERVLFNPGVYHLRDPRSRVFNFDPYLQSIMPIRDFDFSALKEYITSSRDKTLISTAAAHGKKYSGSTSSMTSALAHFHFLLSQWRPISTSTLSQGFPSEYQTFTTLQRAPSAIFLRWRNGTYAIDADKQFDTANILMMLGKSMEKLLTLPTEDFEKYRKQNSEKISDDERNESESYHYTTMGDFLMRSQLDAYDPRLPGTGMFDLKTRAVVSIRMDAKNYENGLGYEIRGRHGEFESYEREYYDMIRSAFLKYSLQVRMGRMDGIFVAFHNTERIFGFQYISLPEMDFALHGSDDTTLGDTEFKTSLELLNRVLDRATAKYPERSLRLHFEAREGVAPFMYIFAEPLSESEIDEIQTSNKAEIAEFERRALGLDRDGKDNDATAEWGSLQAKVEKTMERDELGVDDQPGGSVNIGEVEDITIGEEHDEVERRVNELLSGMIVDEDKEVNDEDEEEEEDDGNQEADDGDEAEEGEDGEEDIRTKRRRIDKAGMIETLENVVDKVADRHPGEVLMQDRDDSMGQGGFQRVIGTRDVEDAGEPKSEIHEGAPDMRMRRQAQADKESGVTDIDMEPDLQACAATRAAEKDPTELLAMTLTIRNKINGRYVKRPTDFTSDDDWDVEYALAEVPQMEKALTLYKASQKRRAASLEDKSEETNKWVNNYITTLHNLSKKGRQWRKEQDQIDEAEPFKILPEIPVEEERRDPK